MARLRVPVHWLSVERGSEGGREEPPLLPFCLMSFCDDDLCQAYSNSHMLSLDDRQQPPPAPHPPNGMPPHSSAHGVQMSPTLPRAQCLLMFSVVVQQLHRSPIPEPRSFPHDSLDHGLSILFHKFHGPPLVPATRVKSESSLRGPFNLPPAPAPASRSPAESWPTVSVHHPRRLRSRSAIPSNERRGEKAD